MFNEVRDEFNSLDILINNAGAGSHGTVENLPVDEWSRTIETNLSGVFYCCREALPLMKEQGSGSEDFPISLVEYSPPLSLEGNTERRFAV